MKIAVYGSNPFADSAPGELTFLDRQEAEKADVIIINEEDFTDIPEGKPGLINSVSETLEDLGKPGWVRFCGWKGFVEKETIEVAGTITPEFQKLFEILGRKYIVVKDEPGFISARILAMIINEAFFALEENVSTIPEIDTAMKLGTNYPKGPFEWGEEIGYSKVAALLEKLSETDSRYEPSPALLKKASV